MRRLNLLILTLAMPAPRRIGALSLVWRLPLASLLIVVFLLCRIVIDVQDAYRRIRPRRR